MIWPTVIRGFRLARGPGTPSGFRGGRAASRGGPAPIRSVPCLPQHLPRLPEPCRISARASVDLPQPDSPTTPSVSPGFNVKDPAHRPQQAQASVQGMSPSRRHVEGDAQVAHIQQRLSGHVRSSSAVDGRSNSFEDAYLVQGHAATSSGALPTGAAWQARARPGAKLGQRAAFPWRQKSSGRWRSAGERGNRAAARATCSGGCRGW
jgi:hypothetical protein